MAMSKLAMTAAASDEVPGRPAIQAAPRRTPAPPTVEVAARTERHLRALFGALMCAGTVAPANGWRLADGRVRIAQRVGLEVVRVTVTGVTADSAWREVFAISPLALDVLAFLVDAFHAQGGDVRLLRCAELLAAKRCRRQGEERLVLEEQIGRELMRLSRFAVGPGEEPLFSVTPVGTRPTSFVASRESGLAFSPVAPRLWFDPRLLEFDHRANRGADVLAKKLGLYLTLAGGAPGAAPVVRNVRTVLRGLGLTQEAQGQGRGGRLVDRFEEARMRLREAGLFAVGYRGDVEDLISGERPKGWLRRWLAAELVVTVPR